MSETRLRLFVAIAMPPTLSEGLAGALSQAALLAPDARASPLENLHLTLRFLGDVPSPGLPALEEALCQVGRAFGSLSLAVEGSGTFGPRGAPWLLYAGVAGELEGLGALASAVGRALGPTDDAPPYRPHVTLARARGKKGSAGLARAREALAGFCAGSFFASELVLYESRLTPAGARYEPRARAPLLCARGPA